MSRSSARYNALVDAELAQPLPSHSNDRRRRPWTLALSIVALVTLVAGGIAAGHWRSSAAVESALARDDAGYRPFDPSESPLQDVAPDSSPSLAERVFAAAGDDCAIAWIERGALCDGLRAAVAAERDGWLDVVWTWVGASARLRLWRDALSEGVRPVEMSRRSRPGVDTVSAQAYHFREHGELRASMRAAHTFLPAHAVRSLTLVTTDLPTADGLTHSRVGQVPTWLDIVAPIRVVHHFSIFRIARSTLASRRVVYADDEAALLSAARQWRASVLPTFDSLSIESQLGHIESDSEALLYFNDDTTVLRTLTPADLFTPLYGPVLRFQPDLLVNPVDPATSNTDREGEWPSLGWSSWLLSKRFGDRPRPYMVHQAKILSRRLLGEVQTIWADEVAQSAAIRFRGRGLALNTPLLLSHYLVERHRELLLWSYFCLRHDADRSGDYSHGERSRMVAEMRSGLSADGSVTRPVRTTVADALDDLAAVGIERPNATVYSTASADGYAWASRSPYSGGSGVVCTLGIEECFALDGETLGPFAAFRRFTYERRECGDCLTLALLGRSGRRGLGTFLPVEDPTDAPSDRWSPSAWPKEWRDPDLALAFPDPRTTTRRQIATLLLRYSYALGESSTCVLAAWIR